MIHLQLQQFLTLLVLLVLAKITAYVYLSWTEIVGLLGFTFVIEHVLIYLKRKEISHISYSALSTSLGVMLMMYATHYWIYILVITVALLQKHFLLWQGRHLFNPSNFALIFALLFFFQDAHIVIGQLGDELWLQGVLLLLAVAILVRARRWVIPVSFTVFYLLFQYFIVLPSDPTLLMEDVSHRFYTVSFVLFVSFMLTDPRTTPKNYGVQVAFSLALALGASIMDYLYDFRVQHLFLMLFLFSMVTVMIETFKKETYEVSYVWKFVTMSVLVLSIIYYIQGQAPYYLVMA